MNNQIATQGGEKMARALLRRWWCIACNKRFYITEFLSKKKYEEGEKFFCPHCGTSEAVVIDEIM
jgi:DNA-directed RNA polymerase subunit RPC12/RpoP